MQTRLESTYVIRLVSSFEGILVEAFPDMDDRLVSLIDAACRRTLATEIQRRTLHTIRRGRNALVHPKARERPNPLEFDIVFLALKTFVNRL